MSQRLVRFLSAELIIFMHDDLLERYGGHPGGGHRGKEYEGVEAAVQAVKNSYYTTMKALAAAHAVYIVQGHVFLDGNKRAGGAAMTTFLEFNRVRCRASAAQIQSLMLELQKRSEAGMDTSTLVRWLANRI